MPCNFQEFDTDGNGHITEEEFMEVADGYGREGTGVVFAILDTNGNYLYKYNLFYIVLNKSLEKKRLF